MGTFHDLPDVVVSPSRQITEDDLDAIVSMGGYTHPLFADAAAAEASAFGGRVLPGPAVVMFMAGLVEQTDLFDHTVVALVGMDDVTFTAPVRPGDRVEVLVEVLDREIRSEGRRGLLHMRWTCRGAAVGESATDDGSPSHVSLVARMLFRLASG